MSEPKFSSQRLERWKAEELGQSFRMTIDHIEDYGCGVLSVGQSTVCPAFTYTTGLYDISNAPELITVGLPYNTAHSALNEAARRLRSGVDLATGRHANVLGNVDVEFRPVAPRWLHHIMLRTNWYYEGADVPVLQMIYPDLQNRFPEDPDFDSNFEQPFLIASFEDESSESDLWLVYDESSSLYRWKFEDSPRVGAYLSQTVHDGTEPVTYVSHDADGDWQFLGDTMSEGGGPVVSCLHHPIDRDRSLEGLHDLRPGWYAVRDKVGEPWQRFEHPPETNESDDGSAPEKVVN